MILQSYAFRDRATVQFSNPMFLVNHGHAIRQFSDEVNRPSTREQPNQFYDHSEDFDLYHIGSYDTDTGVFVARSPEQIAVGKDLRK